MWKKKKRDCIANGNRRRYHCACIQTYSGVNAAKRFCRNIIVYASVYGQEYAFTCRKNTHKFMPKYGDLAEKYETKKNKVFLKICFCNKSKINKTYANTI